MALQQLLISEDRFELVRDQIAQILADEVANQIQIATDVGAPDPQDWNLEVYAERANPWEKWLNDTTVANKVPVINVWFDSDSFDMGQGNVATCQAADGTFNIDCYGYAISSDDGGTGHVAGDEMAARESHRAVRLVRKILMAQENRYLQLQPFVARRWVQSRTSFQPEQTTRSVQRICATRLVLAVKYIEASPEYVGEALECIHVDLKRASDGAILAQMEYLDGCVIPEACDCTATHLDNTFWSSSGQIFWNSGTQEWVGAGTTLPDGYALNAIGGWNVNTFRPTLLKMCIYPGVNPFNSLPSSVDIFVDDTDGFLLGTNFIVLLAEGAENVVTIEVPLDWAGSDPSAGIGQIQVDPDMYMSGPFITCIEFQ